MWDGVLHHGTFNNLDVVELAVSNYSGAAILQSMSYTGSQLNNMTKVNRIYHSERVFFFPSTVFHHDVGDRVRAEACKKTLKH